MRFISQKVATKTNNQEIKAKWWETNAIPNKYVTDECEKKGEVVKNNKNSKVGDNTARWRNERKVCRRSYRIEDKCRIEGTNAGARSKRCALSVG